MQHRRFDKGQRGIAQWQRVTCLDVDKVPVLVVVTADDGLALGSAVDRCVGDFTHQINKSATVVNLVVAHHDIVNIVEVNLFLEIIDELTAVRQP